MRRGWRLGFAFGLASVACATEPLPAEPEEEEPTLAASVRCATPVGMSGRPTTIAAAIELVNALPPPVDVACFLEALERPLPVQATSSAVSAQPARGPDSPRVFIITPPLIISVATEGVGASLVEFAEFTSLTTSIKAEIALPFENELPLAAAFDHIRTERGTTCGGCHRGEVPVEDRPYPGAFSSKAIAPAPNTQLELEHLRQLASSCGESTDGPDAEQEDHERCRILTALVRGGVLDARFPSAVDSSF